MILSIRIVSIFFFFAMVNLFHQSWVSLGVSDKQSPSASHPVYRTTTTSIPMNTRPIHTNYFSVSSCIHMSHIREFSTDSVPLHGLVRNFNCSVQDLY